MKMNRINMKSKALVSYPVGSRPAEVAADVDKLRAASPDALTGIYRGLASLLVDAILSEDDVALSAGQQHLQALYAEQMVDRDDPDPEVTQLGQTAALLDAASWALQRLTPSSVLGALENNPIQRRMLEAVDEIPGMTSEQVGQRLGVTPEQVLATGRPLVMSGLIRKRTLGSDTC